MSVELSEEHLTQSRIMLGHKSSVLAAAFFKDGRRVVTSSSDKTLRIWDVQKGALVGAPFEGHKGWVRAVAISPDDRRIASGGEDKNIILWNVENKQKTLDPLVKHARDVNSLCFSSDGKKLASGSSDCTIVVWDAETGTVLATLRHDSMVLTVVFSPDGLKLASGSKDNNIRVWRTNDAEVLLEFNAHQDRVRSVAWSHDGQQLVSASYDQTVKFWNSSNADQIGQPCAGHTAWIYSLTISFDNSFIATASCDNTVRLWSTKTHQQIGQALEHTTWIGCVVISPNGELLMSGDGDGKVWLWSIKNRLFTDVAAGNVLSTPFTTDIAQNDIQAQPRNEDSDNSDIKSHYSSETHAASSILSFPSSFDNLPMNPTVRNACIIGDLHTAEEILTQEIDTDGDKCDSYASRSVVMARNSNWDQALRDAVNSIDIQPSLMGCISKGIALCGKGQVWNAMEAFDLAFTFATHDSMTINLLLLIKAIALFNAGHREEAIRRVQDLAIACQHLDTLSCNVVNSYLHVQLATIAFENGRYLEAAEQFTEVLITNMNMTGSSLRAALCEPRLKIFTVLFGWDLDSLWQTIHQRQCDAFLRADQVIEAIEAYQYMMRMIDEAERTSCLGWSTTFKQDCIARCVAKGKEAVVANDQARAFKLYSAGIGLDPSYDLLFVHRSNENLRRNLYAEALSDAEQVIKLNPSSHIGYQLKHEALYRVHRYDEAVVTFSIMLSKLEDAPDTQIRQLRRKYHYVTPCEVERAIRGAIHAHLDTAPLHLLNTSTGRLCDRQAQITAFMESTEYEKLMSSLMTHGHLQLECIKEVVVMYFRWVMLSHTWETKEPLLLDIQNKVVYDLDPVGTMVKLQTFCKISRNAGYHWAWSDTCCIDQHNNAELQRSINSMFIWYRHSSFTIVYLSDVASSSKSGALAKSAWNTRGWTLQEFLAPKVILFYQADWTPYLNDRSTNHKESVTIMHELEDATSINAQALVAFRPGMRDEDIAHSLFGIFGVHLPVIYGEKKHHALGRLLQAIVAQSGDISALDWVGKPSEFNSCLPADIASYEAPPCILPSLSEDEMQVSVSNLRSAAVVGLAVALYAQLDNLCAPRFANRRLLLPCITFLVTGVRRRHGLHRETYFTYDIKADGLQDLLITTEDKLTRTQFSQARPSRQTFLLVRPWNHYDLRLPDFSDDMQTVPGSPLTDLCWGYPKEVGLVDLESQSRALRLMVRLGQPFSALLSAQQRGGEYKRIASDHDIVARVKDVTAVRDMSNLHPDMTIVSDDPAWWPIINFCRLYDYFLAACSTAVVYDWALTFGQEFELILRQRWSFMTVLYICVRYIGILYSIINILLMLSIIDVAWNPVIVNAMLGVIMIARINAMYQGSKKLFIFLVVALLASTIASGVMMVIANMGVSSQEAVLSGFHTCVTEIDMDMMYLTYESVISTAVWEILVLFLAVWIVIKHFRELRQSPTGSTVGDCLTILIESHTFYFIAFVTMTCFTLGSLSPNITNTTERLIYFGIWAIAQMLQMFVLGPRLILSVRKSHAKLVARADGGTGMTSIAFHAGGDVLIGGDSSTGRDV
ncbi:uncharacterized protein F5147DRAFT_768429 [Suillus discolor]|uniref:Heterokaryon incompatibility domain-containing protein n=1 Tax=Suillus discolor TaxID=1912936 RepID=A0A9P7FI78_9AGAM|nr:uncharacterized protein F5147DRAFT_768429 [Suillus discolor]KAG2117045.1 hypothetical protein F5147DRAFT_768429 [Suillus discolor]